MSLDKGSQNSHERRCHQRRADRAAVANRKNNDAPKLHLAGASGREAWSDPAIERTRVVALASALAPSMLFIVLDGEGKEVARVRRKQSTGDTVDAMALSDDGPVLVAGTASGQRVVIELEPGAPSPLQSR